MISNHKYFFWSYWDQKKRHWYNFGTGFFIWLFLFFTLPFGMYENNIDSTLSLLLVLLPFGFIWPIISYTIDWLIARVLQKREIFSYKQDFVLFIVKVFILIHAVFIIRNYLSGWSDVYWSEYFEVFGGSILLIGLSYLPFSFYARYSFFQNLVGAPKRQDGTFLELKGEQKATFSIQPDLLFYIKSDDNYLDIVFIKPNGELHKEVFRSRLKWVEAQLKSYSQIFRAHRSYLINLKYFKSVDSRNIKLEYNGTVYEIPVSRSYRKELRSLIK